MKVKQTKPINKTKKQKMKKAIKLLQKNKYNQKQTFQIKLKTLYKKYNINLSTKILITTI